MVRVPQRAAAKPMSGPAIDAGTSRRASTPPTAAVDPETSSTRFISAKVASQSPTDEIDWAAASRRNPCRLSGFGSATTAPSRSDGLLER